MNTIYLSIAATILYFILSIIRGFGYIMTQAVYLSKEMSDKQNDRTKLKLSALTADSMIIEIITFFIAVKIYN